MKPSWDYNKYVNNYQPVADAMNYYGDILNLKDKDKLEEYYEWSSFGLLSNMVMFFNGSFKFYDHITNDEDDILKLRNDVIKLNGSVKWASNDMLNIVDNILIDCRLKTLAKKIDYATH